MLRLQNPDKNNGLAQQSFHVLIKIQVALNKFGVKTMSVHERSPSMNREDPNETAALKVGLVCWIFSVESRAQLDFLSF